MAETSSGAATTPEPAGTTLVPKGYRVLREGQASILQHGNDVFYNPAQVVNRDLSLAVLQYFINRRQEEVATGQLKRVRPKGQAAIAAAAAAAEELQAEGVRILEGLAASGLRSIRYARELTGVARIDANDLDPVVVEAMQRNVDFNGAAAATVRPRQGDARLVMLENAALYDAVDLDPYGTPAQLLDAAVQAVSEGGLLMVTATDMAVLCGNNGEACWAKYGCYPLHRPYCHEMALRILLASIESHANRYKRHIVPVISLSIDFYVRIFVRVYTSAAAVKESAGKQAYVYQSQGCDSFYLQRVGRKVVKGNSTKFAPGSGPAVPERCPETGAGFLMGGPYWAEPIHNEEWVAGILQHVKDNRASFPAYDRILGLLTTVSEELMDVPLYVSLHDISKTVKCTPPKAEYIRSALVNAGYRVSSTHANPLGLKTDAPFDVIWDVMRCWVAEHPVKPQPPDSYIGRLLGKAPTLKANFSRAQGALSAAKGQKVARFLPNPEANWGPKPKHGRVVKAESALIEGASNGIDTEMADQTHDSSAATDDQAS